MNELNYRNHVSHHHDFRISLEFFENWLKEHELEKEFFEKINKLDEEPENIYDIAWDFSIPIIFIKFFQKS